jgi:putative ABC transport system permease protein
MPGESLKMALSALAGNKRRSLITVLGVVIGVGAVIAMVAVGSGARDEVLGSIEGMGSDLVFVNPAADTPGGGPLTLGDAEAVAKLAGVRVVVPQVGGGVTITYQGRSAFAYVFGTTPDFAPVRNAEIAVGRFLTQADLDRSARVAVLGLQNADDLGTRDLLGQQIYISGIAFTVIGLLQPRGSTGPFNQDQVTLIPLTTAMARVTGSDALYSMSVQVLGSNLIPSVQQEIPPLLRTRHRLAATTQDDFVVQSQTDVLGIVGTITSVLTALLGGIAAISLLVGGIGIMNIMLVSVTERTREVGIRKALGARRGDIMAQFLAEAVILSLLGGVIGVGMGYLIARLAEYFLHFLAPVSPSTVLLAVAVSVAIGVFFGVYPAWKASRQDPIEALRYE